MPRSHARVGVRPGFTLIELMVVVVIIGILAAVAIPKFSATTAKADLANVKSDLHTLSQAQENYFYDYAVYTQSLALLNVQPSPSVSITIVEATANGWSATAVHPAAVPVTCAVYYGSATPVAPATSEGVITCQ